MTFNISECSQVCNALGILNKYAGILFAVLAVLCSPVSALGASFVEDIVAAPIAGYCPRQLDLMEVRQMLSLAASKLGWTLEHIQPGLAVATRNKRDRHTIVVEVTYSDYFVSIKYKDSVNMSYKATDDGRASIHPSYNAWTWELLSGIRKAAADCRR